MFERLYELGKTVARRQSREEIHELLRDPIAADYKNVVEIIFSGDGSALESVTPRQLAPSELEKIIYKKGAPNGFDLTAISKFAEVPTKTVNRVKKAVYAIAKGLDTNRHPKSKVKLEAAAKTLDAQQSRITSQVEQAVNALELNVENRGLLSVGFKSGSKVTAVWQMPEVSEFLVEQSMVGYGKNDTLGDCIANDARCSVCRQQKPEVFGNFSELKSYNLDKPGMIAGGFATSQTARNLPVCPECAATVALGINTALTLLAYKMAGQSYLVLPQCDDYELRDLFIELAEEQQNRQSLHEKELERKVEDEKELIEYLTEDDGEIFGKVAKNFATHDRISLKLVFYESEQQSWKIRAEIDQVLPSRVRDIFAAKKIVERRSWNGDGKAFVSMSLIREFAGGSFTNSKREFLGHIDAVFTSRKLDVRSVLRNIVDQILIAFKRDEKKAGYVIRRALMLYDFYQCLGIIQISKGKAMNNAMSEKTPYGKYLDVNAEFFGSPAKRVAFLTGALVRCVMNAQYDKLKSTPFAKKLKGLRITPEMLRKLLGQSKEKLRAYDADHYPANRGLIELLCDQWVACGDIEAFDLSIDEITFFFTVGMTLNYHVTQEFAKDEASADSAAELQASS